MNAHRVGETILKKISLTVIILTYNEEIHIERCVSSVRGIADRILIVDSYSTDRTLEIAKSLDVEVRQHKFVNQAQQFQWALDHCPIPNRLGDAHGCR